MARIDNFNAQFYGGAQAPCLLVFSRSSYLFSVGIVGAGVTSALAASFSAPLS